MVGDDSIQIAGLNAPDAEVKMVWNGETYTKDNFGDLNGKILPANQKVIFYFKNPGWAAGEDHKLTISIIQERSNQIYTRTYHYVIELIFYFSSLSSLRILCYF